MIVRKEFLSHMSDRTLARYWAAHQILNHLGGLEACEAAIKAVCGDDLQGWFSVAAYQRQAMRVPFQYVKEHRLED